MVREKVGLLMPKYYLSLSSEEQYMHTFFEAIPYVITIPILSATMILALAFKEVLSTSKLLRGSSKSF
jgi:hypothetical protein